MTDYYISRDSFDSAKYQSLIDNQDKISEHNTNKNNYHFLFDLADGISELDAAVIKDELGHYLDDDGKLTIAETVDYLNSIGIQNPSDNLIGGLMDVFNAVIGKESGKDVISSAVSNNENNPSYILIQGWGSDALDGNKSANDCLYHIIENYYGVTDVNSDKWKEIANKIMDANPDIYSSGRGTLFDDERINTVIHPGDKLYLPDINLESSGSSTSPSSGETTDFSLEITPQSYTSTPSEAITDKNDTDSIKTVDDYISSLDSNDFDIRAIEDFIKENPDATLENVINVVQSGTFTITTIPQYINNLDPNKYDIGAIERFSNIYPEATLEDIKNKVKNGDFDLKTVT